MSYDIYDELPDVETGICTCCGQPCDVVTVDHGIGSYEYWGARGVHHDYHPGSSCCEADVAEEGDVVVDVTTHHRARKDHVDKRGRVIIHAGRRYRKNYLRTWYRDPDTGENVGMVSITKRELKETA
jgi:hypothetical protein